jgi:hypothetical protein
VQEQLVEDHMMVERIIEEFVEGDETKYLVKWGGLPYMENTWELKEAVLQSVNGEQAIDEYQVSWGLGHIGSCFRHTSCVHCIIIFSLFCNLHPQ